VTVTKAEPRRSDGRSQRRVENRNRIYDAAMGLLRTRSYAEVNVDEICRAAGVGPATFFRIFASKAGLLREFNRRLTRRVEERIAAEAPAEDAAEALRIVVAEITRTWSHAGPGAAAMAQEFIRFSEPGDPHAAHPELLDVVTAITERGMKRGELRDRHPARLVGSLALLQITAAVAWWFEHPDESLDALTGEALTTWLHGALR
jgi:AcrR family transcriptional regulator